MPAKSFRHRAVSGAPPDTVWQRLQDPAVWALVTGVEWTGRHRHRGQLLEGFDFSTHIGGVDYHGQAQVTSSRREETMTLAVKTKEVGGHIRVDLEPAPPGTAVSVEMEMRPAGLVGSFVFPIVTRAVERSFADSVGRLAAALAEPMA